MVPETILCLSFKKARLVNSPRVESSSKVKLILARAGIDKSFIDNSWVHSCERLILDTFGELGGHDEADFSHVH